MTDKLDLEKTRFVLANDGYTLVRCLLEDDKTCSDDCPLNYDRYICNGGYDAHGQGAPLIDGKWVNHTPTDECPAKKARAKNAQRP